MRSWILTLAATTIVGSLMAQSFVRPVEMYSQKKTTYITLKNGEEVEGRVDKVKRKKGLVRLVRIKLQDGSEVEYTPEEIDHAFLPQSSFEKFAMDVDQAYDLTTWDEDSPESELIKEGYAYVVAQKALVKKDVMVLLMQVMNPTFNKEITVFHDPYAAETASVGVAGFKVAGGVQKSYYVKVPGEEVAFRLKKKDYDDNLDRMYGDCDKVKPENDRRMHWESLPKHIYNYTQYCGQ